MTATICILTFNGEQFLDEILDRCLAQQAPLRHEVLVVDSGSTDATLDIVARHPDVRLHRITNREFGHGRTRNLAASLAGGDIVAFLTHDATPADTSWLARLVEPLLEDPTVAGAFGRQQPRPGCGPVAAREVVETFRTAPPPGFFSNVSSAVRRSVLEHVPFRDLDYAEDRAFAADVAAAGLRVAYVPFATVLHSHDLRLGAYFRRMYDEARGVRQSGGTVRTGLVWLAGATARGILLDWAFLAADGGFPPATKVRWALKVPAYALARRLAIWCSARRLPEPVSRFLSLDTSRRRLGGAPPPSPSSPLRTLRRPVSAERPDQVAPSLGQLR